MSHASPPTDQATPADAIARAWAAVLFAARARPQVPSAMERGDIEWFTLEDDGRLRSVPAGDKTAVVTRGRDGWQVVGPAGDPSRTVLDLYLPICGASYGRPVTIAHLAQSLDGFIATHAGESQWITGHENLLHMHRLRAICDAVLVGAGTVAADDPQLTTRLVPGPNPLRVVLDPACRLDRDRRVFRETAAPTVCLCARSIVRPDVTRVGEADLVAVDGTPDALDPAAVLDYLRSRGCGSVFIEGGGATVSSFLRAGVVNRLHVAVAPFVLGEGRPAIRLPAPESLKSCQRPPARVFRMGADILFDLDLRGNQSGSPHLRDLDPPIALVL